MEAAPSEEDFKENAFSASRPKKQDEEDEEDEEDIERMVNLHATTLVAIFTKLQALRKAFAVAKTAPPIDNIAAFALAGETIIMGDGAFMPLSLLKIMLEANEKLRLITDDKCESLFPSVTSERPTTPSSMASASAATEDAAISMAEETPWQFLHTKFTQCIRDCSEKELSWISSEGQFAELFAQTFAEEEMTDVDWDIVSELMLILTVSHLKMIRRVREASGTDMAKGMYIRHMDAVRQLLAENVSDLPGEALLVLLAPTNEKANLAAMESYRKLTEIAL